MIAIFFSVMAYATPGCMTSECHSSLKSAAFVHSPLKAAGSCVICHNVKSEGVGHPKLVPIDLPNINSVCLKCHDNLMTATGSHGSIHPAIEKNTCLGCHEPHSSEFPHLTKENPKFELCLNCHKDMAEKQKSATHHKIDKMENGCLTCHSPHFSANQKLLIKSNPAELCMTCHEKEIHVGERVIASMSGFSSGHGHAPFVKGECFKCHQIHGSTVPALLQKTYSPNLYDNFSTDNFELCFQCHKKTLATAQTTTTETSFRNGDLNLHVLHLANQKKQRTCRSCHDVHSTVQPKLIRQTFTYKDFQLPIQFTQMDNGGKCATACHHDMVYNRTKAFKNEH